MCVNYAELGMMCHCLAGTIYLVYNRQLSAPRDNARTKRVMFGFSI